MTDAERKIVIVRDGNPGAIAGTFGCVFGILGVFTVGLLFVPLAALCSIVGLLRGIEGRSAAGIGISLLGAILTIAAIVSSPSLWLLLAAMVAVHQ